MSSSLNKKLLAEAFDALVNENDTNKAMRLFKRNWDITAKQSYALLESADEDFEISDMGDDFNKEIADEIGSDSEEKFNQAQIAVDELEDKFEGEMSDEISAKFDDVRNVIDELKLADEGENDGLAEDGAVALEELKGEFEMAGELSDEVKDLFNEISTAINGESVSEDVADEDLSDTEEISDVSDEADDMVGEADEHEEELSDEEVIEEPAEGDKDEDELMDDIKYTAEDLASLIDELEGLDSEDEGDVDEPVDESFSKIADPRKKMSSESEGVNKSGTMNFGKLSGMKMDKKAGLNVSDSDSKGTAPSAKVKVQPYENKGVKSWSKVEKPANKPASSGSML